MVFFSPLELILSKAIIKLTGLVLAFLYNIHFWVQDAQDPLCEGKIKVFDFPNSVEGRPFTYMEIVPNRTHHLLNASHCLQSERRGGYYSEE